MSTCVSNFGSSAEFLFVARLAEFLGVQLSKEQTAQIVELLGEFEELKFQQTGVRTSKDVHALPGGGC
jgi:hypothetical protein